MVKRASVGLESDLLKREEGLALYHDIDRIRKHAEPILAKINELFSEYTIHDIRHSEQVLRILSWLIPKKLLERMNDYELFF